MEDANHILPSLHLTGGYVDDDGVDDAASGIADMSGGHSNRLDILYSTSFRCPVLFHGPLAKDVSDMTLLVSQSLLCSDRSLAALQSVFDDFPATKPVLLDQRHDRICLEVIIAERNDPSMTQMHPILQSPILCITSASDKEDSNAAVQSIDRFLAWVHIIYPSSLWDGAHSW